MVKRYNIKSVKITGGEPLLHPQIIEIVRKFAETGKLKDLSLVTNGILLEKMARALKSAGLMRINIGLDSLCNSTVKILDNIKNGLNTVKTVGFNVIKLNMVLLKGINDEEIEQMIAFAKENGFILQIIELIESDAEFYHRFHMNLTEIEQDLARRAIKVLTRQYQDRKQYYLETGAIVEVVHPMHNPEFCKNCHTLRVTHDFKFQPCLNRVDNLVPIGDDLEEALKEVMRRRIPFYVAKECVHD